MEVDTYASLDINLPGMRQTCAYSGLAEKGGQGGTFNRTPGQSFIEDDRLLYSRVER